MLAGITRHHAQEQREMLPGVKHGSKMGQMHTTESEEFLVYRKGTLAKLRASTRCRFRAIDPKKLGTWQIFAITRPQIATMTTMCLTVPPPQVEDIKGCRGAKSSECYKWSDS